jgi:hypothetical protein
MKTIKKSCILMCFGMAACLLWLPSSCTKIEYAEDVPYAARIDSIVPHAGSGKVDFEVYVSSTQIESVRIYWDDRRGMQEISIGGQAGVYSATAEGLATMTYEFTVCAYDKFRHESLPVKTSATVYDEEYLASLWGRDLTKAIHRYGMVTLNWGESVPNEIKTEVVYTNQQGQEAIRAVPPTENQTVINDFGGDWRNGIVFRTHILPEPTALDLYVTDPKNQTLLDVPDIVWDECDEITGWSIGLDGGGALEAGRSGAPGDFSVRAAGSGVIILQKRFEPFNPGISRERGYLIFYLYVEDMATWGTGGGSIEITSGGTADTQELAWGTEQLHLVNGWNTVELKLSDTWPAGGDINLQALNYFRMFNYGTTGATIKIDHLGFYEMP